MKSSLKWVVLIALTVHAFAQNVSPKLRSEFDLRAFGLLAPKKGQISAHNLEILFDSEDHLLILYDGWLSVLDVSNGTVRQAETQEIQGWGTQNEKGISDVLFELRSRYYFGRNARESPLTVKACRSEWPMGIINGQSILCLNPDRHVPIVVDHSGAERYRIKLRGLPWDPNFVSSSKGEKFGLEWTSNSRVQLLEPLACIDECPAPAIQQFLVFSSSDGKLLASFRWDPRPYNLYVLPAISPEGTLAAFVKNDRIVVYSLQ